MMYLVVAILAVAVFVAGALAARRLWRRKRQLRQLESAETEVACAVSESRLSTATGEALLQHLEGLRRDCARGGRE